MNEQNGIKSKRLVFLTVNSSYSHSGMVMALLHQASGHIPCWEWKKWEITKEEESLEAILSPGLFPCDLLCATLYLFNREKTLDLLRRVHVLYPQTHIAVGGPECASGKSAGELLERYPFISSVFTGEGEELFPGFLENFEHCKEWRKIYPESGEKVPYRAWESSPFPVEDPFFRTDRPFVQIETSRGCPMGCSYCTSSGVQTRYRSLTSVEKELTLLKEKGVTEIRVLDRTFNFPRERGESLLRLFYRFTPEMKFHLEIHPQFLDDSLKKCLAEAPEGGLHIEAGMQSFSPEVQHAMGRNCDLEQTLENLRFLCSCKNFETHVDLLGGLPRQSFESLCRDIIVLMQCAPSEIQLEVLKILPGTKILRDLEKYSIVYSPDPPYDVMRTGSMSVLEIRQVKILSRLLDLFYNHASLHPVMLCASGEDPQIFLRLAEPFLRNEVHADSLMNLKRRFLFLDRFFSENGAGGKVKTQLCFQWLLAGYPVNEGPAKDQTQILPSLPEEYTILSGEKESLLQKESKYYLLPREEEPDWILIYNRKYRFNGPCCVCQKGRTPVTETFPFRNE